MVDFTDDNKKGSTREDNASDLIKTAQRFASVRERGMLNAGLDALAQAFVEEYPDIAVRWEYYSPTADNGQDMVTMREAMGWTLCDYSDLKNVTATTPKKGLVRRGDLVLMRAPKEVDEHYRLQDAMAAHADLRAPQIAFQDALERNKVTLSDGSEDRAKGVGTIKVREEFATLKPTTDSGGGS